MHSYVGPNTVAGSVIAEWDGRGPTSTHVIWFVKRDVVRHHVPAALADSARSCGQLRVTVTQYQPNNTCYLVRLMDCHPCYVQYIDYTVSDPRDFSQ